MKLIKAFAIPFIATLLHIGSPAEAASNEPVLTCKIWVNTATGHTLEKEFKGFRSGSLLSIHSSASLGADNFSFNVGANLENNRIEIFVSNTRTKKRYAILNAQFERGGDVYVGADQGPLNGMDNVDVYCTIK